MPTRPRRPRPVPTDLRLSGLTVVLPCFDEEPNVAQAVREATGRREPLRERRGDRRGRRRLPRRHARDRRGARRGRRPRAGRRARRQPRLRRGGAQRHRGVADAVGPAHRRGPAVRPPAARPAAAAGARARPRRGLPHRPLRPAPRRAAAAGWNWLMRRTFGVPVSDVDCAFKLARGPLLRGLELDSDGAMVSMELYARATRPAGGSPRSASTTAARSRARRPAGTRGSSCGALARAAAADCRRPRRRFPRRRRCAPAARGCARVPQPVSGAATADRGLPVARPPRRAALRALRAGRRPGRRRCRAGRARCGWPASARARRRPVLRRRRAQHGDVVARLLRGAFDPSARVSRSTSRRSTCGCRSRSTKLLGFTPTALRPARGARRRRWPSLALYDLLRTSCSAARAALAGALALAVLPMAVITSRSDTMDSVMAALVVVAAALTARAARDDRPRRCCSRPAPCWASPSRSSCSRRSSAPRRSRRCGGWAPAARAAARAALAGARRRVFVRGRAGVAGRAAGARRAPSRPWAFGSTNGSAWNATFVYDGLDRLRGLPAAHTAPRDRAAGQAPLTARQARARALALHRRAAALDHRPADAGPARLFSARAHLGRRIGLALGGALLAFALALCAGVPRDLDRLGRAGWWALGGWLATGPVLFSAQGTLKPATWRPSTPPSPPPWALAWRSRAGGSRGGRAAAAGTRPPGRRPARRRRAAGRAARGPGAGLGPGRRRAHGGRRRARRAAQRPPGPPSAPTCRPTAAGRATRRRPSRSARPRR